MVPLQGDGTSHVAEEIGRKHIQPTDQEKSIIEKVCQR